MKEQGSATRPFTILTLAGLALLFWIIVRTLQIGTNVGLADKTLWDWMELLIVPAALAGAGLWFSHTQKTTELEIAEANRQEDRDIAKQARENEQEIARQERETDRQIANDRQRQAMLDNYFDRMTELILDKQLYTTKDENVRLLAQARTQNILRELGDERIRQVIQFIQRTKLGSTENGLLKKVYLDKANLSGVNLQATCLDEASLNQINLRSANLIGASLISTHLNEADLSEAQLSGAQLRNASLDKANLIAANLSKANLSAAHLGGTHLNGTDFSGADLSGVTFRTKYLNERPIAKFPASTADIETMITNVGALDGAIMPDGRKFEEWLTERKAQNTLLETQEKSISIETIVQGTEKETIDEDISDSIS